MEPTGLLLAMTASRWHRAVEPVLQEHGVSLLHVQLLEAIDTLCKRGTAPHQADVSRYTGIDVMTLSINVRALTERELIARHTRPHDARRVFVELTEPGSQLLATVREGLFKADAVVFPNDDRRTALRHVLTTCVEDTTA
jgi:DNA-binding MarR family transcriptional regulator